MIVQIEGTTLELVEGDITLQQVDAIVNAANAQLAGGGGVDGAIHRAGGPEIMAECRRIGGCPTGEAVATTAGRLKAKKVIHAVGPMYRGGVHGEAESLASAYRNALSLAIDLGMKSIAAPSLSTGAYGYPMEAAARVALATAIDLLKERRGLALVRFVLSGQEAFRTWRGVLEELSPTQKIAKI